MMARGHRAVARIVRIAVLPALPGAARPRPPRCGAESRDNSDLHEIFAIFGDRDGSFPPHVAIAAAHHAG